MEIYDQNVIDLLKANPEIKSLGDAISLHNKLIRFRGHLFEKGIGEFIPHYRSEQNYGWDITPGMFRGKGSALSPTVGKDLEQKVITEFEEVVTAKLGSQTFRDLFNQKPNGKNWDLLFQAQHGGIHTSLIDWTMDIAPSLFFGIEESTDPQIEAADGQLWAYMLPEHLLLNDNADTHKESFHDHNPFNLNKGFMINLPIYLDNLEDRIYEQRISRQGGRFYISPGDKSNIPMNRQTDIAKYLFRFRIPAEFKSVIREELNQKKINRSTIYVKENSDHLIWTNDINKKIFGF